MNFCSVIKHLSSSLISSSFFFFKLLFLSLQWREKEPFLPDFSFFLVKLVFTLLSFHAWFSFLNYFEFLFGRQTLTFIVKETKTLIERRRNKIISGMEDNIFYCFLFPLFFDHFFFASMNPIFFLSISVQSSNTCLHRTDKISSLKKKEEKGNGWKGKVPFYPLFSFSFANFSFLDFLISVRLSNICLHRRNIF